MAAETNGDIIWVKDETSSDHDEVWDDSALIDAYDRAVGQVKEELERRKQNDQNGTKKKVSHKTKSKNTWKVGDYCNTVFPEDCLYYEAYIKEISESGDKCLIQFVGYGNEIVSPISDLKASLGKQAREKQEFESQQATHEVDFTDFSMDWSKNDLNKRTKPKVANQSKSIPRQHSASHIPLHSQCSSIPHSPSWPGFYGQQRTGMPTIPPPPPFPLDQSVANDEEALAAMLMSWYMSGYHTGYYQGMRQSQGSQPDYRKFQPSCTGCGHSPR